MPDKPDWYVSSPASTRVSLDDMAELAARIGSPVTFDRRGEVLFYDTFKHGLSAWSLVTAGTGAGVKLIAEETYRPGCACKLIGGSDGSRYASIIRYTAYQAIERIGIETSFRMIDRPEYLYLGSGLYRDSGIYAVEVRIPAASDIIEYRASDGSYVQLGTISDPRCAAIPMWHNWKLVVDIETLEYVRCIYDDHEFDMSGLGLYWWDVLDYEWIYSAVTCYSSAGNNEEVVIGQVIVTGAEP